MRAAGPLAVMALSSCVWVSNEKRQDAIDAVPMGFAAIEASPAAIDVCELPLSVAVEVELAPHMAGESVSFSWRGDPNDAHQPLETVLLEASDGEVRLTLTVPVEPNDCRNGCDALDLQARWENELTNFRTVSASVPFLATSSTVTVDSAHLEGPTGSTPVDDVELSTEEPEGAVSLQAYDTVGVEIS